ncbi:Meiosis protein mei2 [Pelomyxa schiedti]|nr:Meiosis protein mei2 [Pelomyxa schiedti]
MISTFPSRQPGPGSPPTFPNRGAYPDMSGGIFAAPPISPTTHGNAPPGPIPSCGSGSGYGSNYEVPGPGMVRMVLPTGLMNGPHPHPLVSPPRSPPPPGPTQFSPMHLALQQFSSQQIPGPGPVTMPMPVGVHVPPPVHLTGDNPAQQYVDMQHYIDGAEAISFDMDPTANFSDDYASEYYGEEDISGLTSDQGDDNIPYDPMRNSPINSPVFNTMEPHYSTSAPSSTEYTAFGEHPFGEHPSHTLFVRNINSNVDDEELQELFLPYGEIRNIYTHAKHRGFVMVSYYDIRCAKNAMKHLQGRLVRKRKIDIHYSIPKDNPSEKEQNQGTLVVFNLDPNVTNEDLRVCFGRFGEIKEIRETPHKRHHKFIEFYDIRDAERAMKSLNKTDLKGKKIKIEPSRPGGVRQKLLLNSQTGSSDFEQTSGSTSPVESGLSPPMMKFYSKSPQFTSHLESLEGISCEPNFNAPTIMKPSAQPFIPASQSGSTAPPVTHMHPSFYSGGFPNGMSSVEIGGIVTPEQHPPALSVPGFPSRPSQPPMRRSIPHPLQKALSESSLFHFDLPISPLHMQTPHEAEETITSSQVRQEVPPPLVHFPIQPKAMPPPQQTKILQPPTQTKLAPPQVQPPTFPQLSPDSRPKPLGPFPPGNPSHPRVLAKRYSAPCLGEELSSLFSSPPGTLTQGGPMNKGATPPTKPQFSMFGSDNGSSQATDGTGSRNGFPNVPGDSVVVQDKPIAYPHNVHPHTPSPLPMQQEVQLVRPQLPTPSAPLSQLHTQIPVETAPPSPLHNPQITQSPPFQRPSSPQLLHKGLPLFPTADTKWKKDDSDETLPSTPLSQIFSGLSLQVNPSPSKGGPPSWPQARVGRQMKRQVSEPTLRIPGREPETNEYSSALAPEHTITENRTTLLIKNIPVTMNQKILQDMIDSNNRGTYDFLYLPVGTKNKCNIGYAFINLISTSHIPQFVKEFHLRQWEQSSTTNKPCEISYSKLQGLSRLIENLRNLFLAPDGTANGSTLPIVEINGVQQPYPVGTPIRFVREGNRDILKQGM